MSFQSFYDKTYLILYTCQLFGICGNVSVTEKSRWNKFKKYFLICYSIFLVVFNALDYHITASTKYSGHNGSYLSEILLKQGFWTSKIIIFIIMPMNLQCHEKFKSVVANVCRDSEVDVNDINFNRPKYFIVFLIIIWLLDAVAWMFLNTGESVWEKLLAHILIKYMDHVVSLCCLKFTLIVIILVEVLCRFNENLETLEQYLSDTFKNHKKLQVEIQKLKPQLLIVVENTREVSEIVGPSLVVILLCCIIMVSALSYSVLELLLEGHNVLLNANALTIIIEMILCPLVLINCCNSLSNEYRRGRLILQKLTFLSDDEKIIQQIGLLSTQHRLSDIQIKACGYLTITNLTWFQYMSTMVIYLIILTQTISK